MLDEYVSKKERKLILTYIIFPLKQYKFTLSEKSYLNWGKQGYLSDTNLLKLHLFDGKSMLVMIIWWYICLCEIDVLNVLKLSQRKSISHLDIGIEDIFSKLNVRI